MLGFIRWISIREDEDNGPDKDDETCKTPKTNEDWGEGNEA